MFEGLLSYLVVGTGYVGKELGRTTAVAAAGDLLARLLSERGTSDLLGLPPARPAPPAPPADPADLAGGPGGEGAEGAGVGEGADAGSGQAGGGEGRGGPGGWEGRGRALLPLAEILLHAILAPSSAEAGAELLQACPGHTAGMVKSSLNHLHWVSGDFFLYNPNPCYAAGSAAEGLLWVHSEVSAQVRG